MQNWMDIELLAETDIENQTIRKISREDLRIIDLKRSQWIGQQWPCLQYKREDRHLRKSASKWVSLTEVEKWTRYEICHVHFFTQNPHYSYIQEHLTPFTSICILVFLCLFMIYPSCQNKSCHDLIPKSS